MYLCRRPAYPEFKRALTCASVSQDDRDEKQLTACFALHSLRQTRPMFFRLPLELQNNKSDPLPLQICLTHKVSANTSFATVDIVSLSPGLDN